MIEIKSYLAGEWVSANPERVVLVNPATEEPVAVVTSGKADFARALDHARNGGAALRSMTFGARGEILRAMSKAIHAKRDELIGLAISNGGNTRSDAKFDIDGAIATLAAYADIGAELAETRVLLDGEGAALGRSARMFGQHAFVPRMGVAVHINAFNFPAWGMCEKASVALLAGMPVISKPATSTALVAFRMMQMFVDEKILPEGALSFVAGSSGDLLERLGGQDVLAFTGSSDTGAKLRSGKSVIAHSVRVNVEADSLNSAVLGPDVEDGSDVLNLFVSDVVRDMTQKTGQKCTAIRRVYAPQAMLSNVTEKIRERLAAIKVGDPSREDVNMGPVATKDQLRDVREGIKKLLACGRAVIGGADAMEGLGVAGGKGYFVAPTLIAVDKPNANDAVHTDEVFGPVASIMPYDGHVETVSALVAAGGGGLVSSVYSDSKEFVQKAILALAPYHGRLTIGSTKVFGQTIPPGTVMPNLVHGGPGRAGGGEELGGRRGLSFYMQRVAIQGDRALVETAVLKR